MENSYRNWLKRVGWTSAGLCVLCCLLPVIGLSVGVASLGVIAFYLEKVALGILALSVIGLLIWRAPKKSEAVCASDCDCAAENSSNIPIACDLSAISNEKRGEHIETAKNLFASFKEVKDLPDGYAFRVPPDFESIMRTAEFTTTERLCCPFFTFTLQIKGNEVWLSLTGGEAVKSYLRDTLIAEGDVLSLDKAVHSTISQPV